MTKPKHGFSHSTFIAINRRSTYIAVNKNVAAIVYTLYHSITTALQYLLVSQTVENKDEDALQAIERGEEISKDECVLIHVQQTKRPR